MTVTFTNHVRLKQWSFINAVHQQNVREEHDEDCVKEKAKYICLFLFPDLDGFSATSRMQFLRTEVKKKPCRNMIQNDYK